MRIGMILDAPFPPDPRVENEALSLIEAGHEVFLFSLDFELRSGIEIYKGIKVIRYPASNLLYKLSALAYTLPFYHWKVSRYIKRFIKDHNIQSLHIHDMVIAEAVFSVNRLFRLPIVLDMHENRPEIMKEYKHVNTFSGKLLIRLKQWTRKYYDLITRADFVVVVTDAAKEDILKKTSKDPNSIIAVPNTVRITEFTSGSFDPAILERMSNSFNLLYIGDTSLRRGTDTVIRALGLLKDKIPNLKFWLIGKSSADEELKRLASTTGVSNLVTFEGWQQPSTFLSYAQNAHVTLSPLKRNIHHDTTYANKIFQYMACGRPLIVSDCTAQADLIREERCGLVYVASNAEDLAKKILYLYRNPDDAREMGANAKKTVFNKWHWEVTVKPLTDMYEQLI